MSVQHLAINHFAASCSFMFMFLTWCVLKMRVQHLAINHLAVVTSEVRQLLASVLKKDSDCVSWRREVGSCGSTESGPA